jgi:hypothetical protein
MGSTRSELKNEWGRLEPRHANHEISCSKFLLEYIGEWREIVKGKTADKEDKGIFYERLMAHVPGLRTSSTWRYRIWHGGRVERGGN